MRLISAVIQINEIMYDPYDSVQCPDANCEWIELYNNGTVAVELDEWTIDDNSFEDVIILPNEYVIVARELIDLNGGNSFEAYWGNNNSVWDSDDGNYEAVDGDFSLKNSGGDTIILKNNNDTLVDNVSYTDICESGYSLEYFDGNFYCSFYLGGTPGKPNSHRTQDYSNIIINEFLPDPKGDDNAPMPDGEFIELCNKGDNETDLAGLYFKDSAGHKLYITDTTTIDGTIIEPESCLAVYTNEFSGFLNNQGFEEISLYDPCGNLIDKITYASSEESLSWALIDNIWHYRHPSPNEINPKEKVEMESSFKILGLEDIGNNNESEFGDMIKVNFYVYKGNTTKSSIKLYIENDEDRVSKITKAELTNKYTNYSLTLPIQIKPNCNEKYEDGDYYVKIGWTSLSKEEDSFRIKLKGINEDNCDKMYVERKPKKGTLNHNLMEAPGAVEPDKDFTVKVELMNNDEEDHKVDLYSYVYRGNKCYSPARESNKKIVMVKAGETKEIELDNIVRGAEPGDYSLKIKIKRDDQKTEKEVNQPIKVLAEGIQQEKEGIETKEEKIDVKEKEIEDFTTLESQKQPAIVYESTSIKAKNLVVYLFVGLLVIYAAILTWKR